MGGGQISKFEHGFCLDWGLNNTIINNRIIIEKKQLPLRVSVLKFQIFFTMARIHQLHVLFFMSNDVAKG